MIITLSNISLNIEILYYPDHVFGTLILLHGFSGSTQDWRHVFSEFNIPYKVIAIDLPGHGKSDSPVDLSAYTADAMVEQLREIITIEEAEQITLCGYSMGGRLALSFAAKYPSLINKLILESSSPGITDMEEKMNRIQADESLADFIVNNPIEIFVEQWLGLPIFTSLKNISVEKYESHKNRKLNNNCIGLANSLRAFGTGKMPELWSVLPSIKTNTLLIVAEQDTKFTAINKEIWKRMPVARLVIVKDTGHIIHLEKPKDFVNLVTNFLID